MHYLYILRSESTGKSYIGSTSDLQKRFYQHNRKSSVATKASAPWTLIYYEAYPNKSLALKREIKLKQYGQSWRRLKERLEITE